MNTPALAAHHRANFQTLLRAAENGHLALMSCLDAATGEPRAVLAAANFHEDGSVEFVPFGHLAAGNPYDAYLPPESEPEVIQ